MLLPIHESSSCSTPPVLAPARVSRGGRSQCRPRNRRAAQHRESPEPSSPSLLAPSRKPSWWATGPTIRNSPPQRTAAAVGYDSILWEALISAQKLGPTAIVFITDAAALDLNEVPLTAVPADRLAQVEGLGPPTVIVGVGTVDRPPIRCHGVRGSLARRARLRSGRSRDAVSAALHANPLPSYLLTLLVPEEGPNTSRPGSDRGLSVDHTSYQVPPRESRVTPPSLVGLHLTVRHQGQAVRRRLAGIDPERRAQFSPDTVAEVRSALFRSSRDRVRGGGPAGIGALRRPAHQSIGQPDCERSNRS